MEFNIKEFPSVDYTKVWSAIRRICTSFVISRETKDKDGKKVAPHFHGWCCGGGFADSLDNITHPITSKTIENKVRDILRPYVNIKEDYSCHVMKIKNPKYLEIDFSYIDDNGDAWPARKPTVEEVALAYMHKEGNIQMEYNLSHPSDWYIQLWEQMKNVSDDDYEKKKHETKDIMQKNVMATLLELDRPPCLDDVKIAVAKQMILDNKLPTMGKVRAYATYICWHKDYNFPVSDYDIVKML